MAKTIEARAATLPGEEQAGEGLAQGGSKRAAGLALLLAALGPGVIGLMADNDAGGMLSYLVTGAYHGLLWMLPMLVLLAFATLFVQWVSLRVVQATGSPYSRVLVAGVGRPLALLEAVVLYALNTLVLATEFLGMALALSLAGVPAVPALAGTLGCVVMLTSAKVYPRIEQLLLRVAVLNLAFVPALLLVHHAGRAWADAFAATRAEPGFLFLALAGNAMAPWMIYWQQNAQWAGVPRTNRQQLWDLVVGVAAMTAMAAVALALGAVTPGEASAFASPLRWVFVEGGHAAGLLLAVGLFDAGLLAACTVSLASLWTLREALGRGLHAASEAPNRGKWRLVHVGTLALAASVVLWPHLAAGRLVLWAQALSGMWMPVSLVLLGLVARHPRLMGRLAVPGLAQLALALVAAGFVALAVLGLVP